MLSLILLAIDAALGAANSLVGQLMSNNNKAKNRVIVSLGIILFVMAIAIGIANYRDSQQSEAKAQARQQTLNAQIESLQNQNQGLKDQLGDANARLLALTAKLHVPAKLSRSMSDSNTTKDSIK